MQELIKNFEIKSFKAIIIIIIIIIIVIIIIIIIIVINIIIIITIIIIIIIIINIIIISLPIIIQVEANIRLSKSATQRRLSSIWFSFTDTHDSWDRKGRMESHFSISITSSCSQIFRYFLQLSNWDNYF